MKRLFGRRGSAPNSDGISPTFSVTESTYTSWVNFDSHGSHTQSVGGRLRTVCGFLPLDGWGSKPREMALKDILDLLEEFSRLNDAKTQSKGRLPRISETRWRDLKALYDRLMSRQVQKESENDPQIASADIRERIRHRERLRVRADMETFFRYRDDFLPSRLVNLSRGGLFLSSKVLLDEGSQITLYLPNLGSDYGELFETHGEVVWTTRGIPAAGLPRGMGIRFLSVNGIASEQLDSYIIEALRKRLEK
jgi:hypothetical protein